MDARGFTLVELMIVLVIAGIVMTFGVPAMTDYIRNSRLTASVNDLVATVNFARSEAIKRRGVVVICTSLDPTEETPECEADAPDWTDGWVVFVDADADAEVDAGEAILQRQIALHESLFVRTDDVFEAYLAFDATGRSRDVAGTSTAGNLVVCDVRGIEASMADLSTARAVNVSRTGRPLALRDQASIAALDIDCP